MKDNEKAAAGVASADSSRRDQASQQDLPKSKYTTREAVVQVVETFLLTGAENAITTKTLVKLTGLGVKDLPSQVARKREASALILAKGHGGRFLPGEGKEGRDELRRFPFTTRLKSISLWRATSPAWEELERQVKEESDEEEETATD